MSEIIDQSIAAEKDSLPEKSDEKNLGESISSHEIRSSEVHDIFSTIPNKLIRFGSIFILTFFFLVIVGSKFVSYPDILLAEILVTTTTPPVKIVTGGNGEIKEILVRENQTVKKRDVLAVIDNTASYSDVLELKAALDSLSFDVDRLESLTLGELSNEATRYFDGQKKLQLFLGLHLVREQRLALIKQIEDYRQLKSDQLTQHQLLKQDVELTQKDFNRNQKLLSEGVISPQQFEAVEKELISSKRQLSTSKQSISSTEITISGLEKNITELEEKEIEEQAKLQQTIEHDFQTLNAAILSWEKKYILRSPANGAISFTGHWTVGQYVEQGEPIFWLTPDSYDIIGKVKLPLRKSGKVKTGQLVRIKIDNYPFEEYGSLLGQIKNISLLPTDQSYLIDVEFPNGLVTSYKRTLDFHQQMQGTASIITEELSIFDRVFYQFKKLYDSH